MKHLRLAAILFLTLVAASCLLADFIAPASYAQQFRDAPNAASSAQHLLGTDDLGRDRFSRLLYGTRVSLLLAPAAALLSSLLAALIGGAAGFFGGWLESCVMAATDLFLSLPWLFLLITVRALLPLNVSPIASVAITFALLGCLGWAAAARVVCAYARALCDSEIILLARATGCSGLRLLMASHCSQSQAGSLRPVLDLDSRLHPHRSKPRHVGPRCRRAASFLGQLAARIGKLLRHLIRSLASSRLWFCSSSP